MVTFLYRFAFNNLSPYDHDHSAEWPDNPAEIYLQGNINLKHKVNEFSNALVNV